MGESKVELTVTLAPDLLERLQAKARAQHLNVPDVVATALEAYLSDDERVIEDTPDEVVLDGFRQGMREALTGQTRPADVWLAEIKGETRQRGDQS